MDGFIVTYPEHIPTVCDVLIEANWLITNYTAAPQDIYNPANYLYNKYLEGASYIIVPDRNILSYILSSTSQDRCSEQSRIAIGLILFCQFSEIQIEPNLALYEYLDFNTANIEKTIDEIETFRAIDSYSEDPILEYFLGYRDFIPITNKPFVNRDYYRQEYLKTTWLKEWDSFYLMTLKIIDIAQLDKSNNLKLEELVLWMSDKYRRSLVVIVFAVYLFSNQKRTNMIKYKAKDSVSKKLAAIKNMTWDFYYMNRAFRLWQEKEESEEFIFASNDKIVQEILRFSIDINRSGNFDILKTRFSKELDIERLFDYLQTNTNRVYESEIWTEEYRDSLIAELVDRLVL